MCNTRMKVTCLLPVIRDNTDQAAFNKYTNDTGIMHGIDDELEVNDDLANKMATQLWMKVLVTIDTRQ